VAYYKPEMRWSTHQLAAAPLRTPAAIKMLFTTLVSIVRSGAVSFTLTRQLPVSICSLCFPSDNEAMRAPMKTYKRYLGELQMVATMNCQTDTDCID
jgi:hypothetical protein